MGFLRVVGPSRIAFADYTGNRQFISQGNIQTNYRVSLFLMDYAAKARLKIQGHARLVDLADAAPRIVAQVVQDGTPVERILTIDIAAMDWNCPKYIPSLYPEALAREAIARAVAPLQAEVAELRGRFGEV
ncbi:MAG: hypothetical protein MK180_17995 [Rhodobacteraceae bacterium]|nr:hypothetical protein [Paracoccaceae bacterium]